MDSAEEKEVVEQFNDGSNWLYDEEVVTLEMARQEVGKWLRAAGISNSVRKQREEEIHQIVTEVQHGNISFKNEKVVAKLSTKTVELSSRVKVYDINKMTKAHKPETGEDRINIFLAVLSGLNIPELQALHTSDYGIIAPFALFFMV